MSEYWFCVRYQLSGTADKAHCMDFSVKHSDHHVVTNDAEWQHKARAHPYHTGGPTRAEQHHLAGIAATAASSPDCSSSGATSPGNTSTCWMGEGRSGGKAG